MVATILFGCLFPKLTNKHTTAGITKKWLTRNEQIESMQMMKINRSPPSIFFFNQYWSVFHNIALTISLYIVS